LVERRLGAGRRARVADPRVVAPAQTTGSGGSVAALDAARPTAHATASSPGSHYLGAASPSLRQ
jgi:hypothetical protein